MKREYNLEADSIRLALADRTKGMVETLEVAAEIDSTNSELLRRAAPASGRGYVLLAKRQTAGRGRRGRAWLAAPGEVLCLSVGRTFAPFPSDLSSLSLAVGVCIAKALEKLGISRIALKWPNDLESSRRKLGGILIETRTESRDAVYVVVGVGLNLALSKASTEAIRASGTEPVDVLELANAEEVDPNSIAACVIETIIEGLGQFADSGFGNFFGDWNRLDSLCGASVRVLQEGTDTLGIARGIDLTGALLVETPGGLKRFISGEVSVRPAA